jgi:hypothetical protein
MRSKARKAMALCVVLGLVGIHLWGCALFRPTPSATLEVIPPKTVLTPKLIKNPVQFKGSGFTPREMVVVEMVPPKGVTIKGVPEGENVGLAFGKADENGSFSAKMAPTATLNWFFQVGWTPNMKPDFKKAKPLPPGRYAIKATGMDSGAVGEAYLEILPPPKKK